MGATIGCRHGTIDATGTAATIAGVTASTAAAIAGVTASTAATIAGFAASTNSKIEHKDAIFNNLLRCSGCLKLCSAMKQECWYGPFYLYADQMGNLISDYWLA